MWVHGKYEINFNIYNWQVLIIYSKLKETKQIWNGY